MNTFYSNINQTRSPCVDGDIVVIFLGASRINHDENRIPVDIPEAKCSCVGCINPFTMQEDRTMTSVLIYTKIPVRRRLCDRLSKKPRKKKKCVPLYRTVVESIAVGCTCIV